MVQKHKLKAKPFSHGYMENKKVDFKRVARILPKLNVYFFVPHEPVTAYNLPTIFIEDFQTGDWFPFSNYMALQGTGGGWQILEEFMEDLSELSKSKEIHLSLKLFCKEDEVSLMNGNLTWQEFKNQSIPLLISDDEELQRIAKRFYDELGEMIKSN